MKRRTISILVVLALVVLGAFSFPLGHSRKLKAQADVLVEKIELHRKTRGILPQSIEDVGLRSALDGRVYYRKESENHYVVWYGKELGESATYDSSAKIWK